MGQKIWPLWKPQHAAAASCSLAESLVLSLSVKTFYFWAAGESNPWLLPAAWTVALLLLQLAACCRHGRSVSPASASVQSLQASASAAVRLCDRESCVCWHRVCVCVCCDVTAANALSRCSNMDCDCDSLSVSVALRGHSFSARPLVRTNAIFSLFGLLCWLKLFALFCFI